MLLEFKARNYKSFKDELCLSMIPDDDETALDYSVMTEQVAGETFQALCSTVVYGPNASGKTNVISALDTFRAIVLRGNIYNTADYSGSNPAAFRLELIPNSTAETPHPVEFSIRFITDGVLIDYSFSANLGVFLQGDYPRNILSENLSVNEISIFKRTDSVEVEADTLRKFPAFFKATIPDNLIAIRNLPGWDVDKQQLFLGNGFSSLLSPTLYKLITGWLFTCLITLCRSDAYSISEYDISKLAQWQHVSKDSPSLMMGSDILNDAIGCIGSRNHMGYLYDPQTKRSTLSSVGYQNGQNRNFVIPAEIFESYGTYRFVNLLPPITTALLYGGTLVLDEFDASLHPMVLMNIISLFHDPEINRNHAQLIFNTHNPIFLDRSLFRRDEIKFVERDEETQSSEIYALSDFEPEPESDVEPEKRRDCEDYLGNYFRNRYGAIQYVDLAPVFRKVMGLDKDGEPGEG